VAEKQVLAKDLGETFLGQKESLYYFGYCQVSCGEKEKKK